jgi:hypothetical protein
VAVNASKEGAAMSGEKISTSTLLQRLFKTKSLDRFIKHMDNVQHTLPLFHEYINQLCAERKIPPERILKKADIERTNGHKFFNGTRNPSRDRVIQLAFGFDMNYNETQKLLTLAQRGTLYPKVKRDAVIIFALERGLDVTAVQATLFELHMPLLGEER